MRANMDNDIDMTNENSDRTSNLISLDLNELIESTDPMHMNNKTNNMVTDTSLDQWACPKMNNKPVDLINMDSGKTVYISNLDNDVTLDNVVKSRYEIHDKNGFTLFSGKPNREIDFDCPIERHFRTAEVLFLRMLNEAQNRGNYFAKSKFEIVQIDYIDNPSITSRFNAKKAEFRSLGIDTRELTFFHGTRNVNVDSILTDNFDLSRCHRFAHGVGIYFSEFPDISLRYGRELILCRVLPGRVQTQSDGRQLNREQFDSLHVDWLPDHIEVNDNSLASASKIHVISNPDQILPYCRIHIKFPDRRRYSCRRGRLIMSSPLTSSGSCRIRSSPLTSSGSSPSQHVQHPYWTTGRGSTVSCLGSNAYWPTQTQASSGTTSTTTTSTGSDTSAMWSTMWHNTGGSKDTKTSSSESTSSHWRPWAPSASPIGTYAMDLTCKPNFNAIEP